MLLRGTAAEIAPWLARWAEDMGWPLIGPDHRIAVADATPEIARLTLEIRPGGGAPAWWADLAARCAQSFGEVPIREWPRGESVRVARRTLDSMPPDPPPLDAPREVADAWRADLAAWQAKRAAWAPVEDAVQPTRKRAHGVQGSTMERVKEARALWEAGTPKTRACKRAGIDPRTYDRYVLDVIDVEDADSGE